MNTRLRGLYTTLAVLVIVAAVACCPFGQRVTLSAADGTLLYASYVPRGEYVWILYNHSVNKSLVEDGFEPLGNTLYLRASRFRAYGAGIPEPEAGQTFTAHDGYYEITGYDMTLTEQWTYVGRVADHRLRIGDTGEPIHFTSLAEPGTRVVLRTDGWTPLKEIIWRCTRA